MRWLLSTYTFRFNPRHQQFGHVFSGRYKALMVDGSGDGYLRTACDYVHLNPVRAKLRRSFNRIAPQSGIAAMIFYRNLFTLDPSLRSLFHTTIELQGEVSWS